MPPDPLTAFLQYGYGTIKDESTASMTLYVASLAFLAAFSDKVLNIATAPSEVRRWIDVGLWSLITAVILVFITMMLSHSMLSELELWSPQPILLMVRLDKASSVLNRCRITLALSEGCYVLSLISVFAGSKKVTFYRRHEEKKEKKKNADEEKRRVDLETRMQALEHQEKKRRELEAHYDESIKPWKSPD